MNNRIVCKKDFDNSATMDTLSYAAARQAAAPSSADSTKRPLAELPRTCDLADMKQTGGGWGGRGEQLAKPNLEPVNKCLY